jgi:hypothetical protein
MTEHNTFDAAAAAAEASLEAGGRRAAADASLGPVGASLVVVGAAAAAVEASLEAGGRRAAADASLGPVGASLVAACVAAAPLSFAQTYRQRPT